MTDSENRDNKPKVLGLKSGTNTVRQSFSHGRSKSVVVETKKKKLLISKKGPVIEENNKNVGAEIEANENEDNQEQDQEEYNSNGEEESTPEIPEEFILDPEACAVDPDLLLFSSAKAKAGNSGSRSVIFCDSRGRYV